jgi:hypothetical protein
MGISMKKIAIFVEGQTEQEFAAELIREIFGVKNAFVQTFKMKGKRGSRYIRQDSKDYGEESTAFSIYIYDSGSDEMVKTDILENYAFLVKSSFSYIIGIQDVYNPKRKNLSDIDKFRKSINYGFSTEIPVHIILAVNEIEGWFINEERHYANVSLALTLNKVNMIIKESTGIHLDVSKDTTEVIKHPAVVLADIYQSEGVSYEKNKYIVQNTVYALDYDNLYVAVRNRNDSLNELLTCLDELIP